MDQLTPTLAVVVASRRDWHRVCAEGWYRIPLKYAPQPVAAEYLAFYLTRRCGSQAWCVPAYAAVRRELIAAEPDHPRADDLYYRVALGPLQLLPRPLPSRRLRRVTFIPTTLETLLAADDVADLWETDGTRAVAWRHFPDAARKATQRLTLLERPLATPLPDTKMPTS